MATEITMSLAEWQDRQTRIVALEAELEKATTALDEARLGDGDSSARRLAAALANALPVVQFAVANCTPRMFPGWPHVDLTALALALRDLPGVDPMVREQAIDLGIFARGAAEWEEARANGTHELKFLEENASGLSLPKGALDGAASLLPKG